MKYSRLIEEYAKWVEHERIFWTLLGSLCAASVEFPLSDAPRYPVPLKAWLRECVDFGYRYLAREDGRATAVRSAPLLRLLPLILHHSSANEWNWLENDTGHYFCLEQEASRNDSADAAFLSVLGRFRGADTVFFEARPYGTTAALASIESSWTRPLKIAMHGWPAPVVERLKKHFNGKSSPICLEDAKLYQPERAAILLMNDDAEGAFAGLGTRSAGQYSYIVISGNVISLERLRKLSNRAKSAGAAALQWGGDTTEDRLFRFMSTLSEAILENSDATIVQLLHLDESTRPVIYAHPSTVGLTSMSALPRLLHRQLGALPVDSNVELTEGLAGTSLTPGPTSIGTLMSELRSGELNKLGRTSFDASGLKALYEALDATRAKTDPRVEQVSARGIPQSAGPRGGPPILVEGIGPVARQPLPQIPVRVAGVLYRNGASEKSLLPMVSHELQVQLTAEWAGKLAATGNFPVDQLPTDRDEIELQFVFLPLRGEHVPLVAQRSKVTFSRTGAASDLASFKLLPAEKAKQYAARLLVMHRNRVLQSLLFTAGVGSATESGLQFEVENLVVPGLSQLVSLAGARPFDLALVLNHSPSKQAGIMAVTDGFVSFSEPSADFQKMISHASDELTILNSLCEHRLDHQEMTPAFRKLARLGCALRERVMTANPELLALAAVGRSDPLSPLRVQVVEAVRGSHLPVELFYDGEVPGKSAELCTKFGSMDFAGESCRKCEDRGTKALVCPLQFWGVSKIIERRPWRVPESLGSHAYALAESSDRVQGFKLERAVFGVTAELTSDQAAAVQAAVKHVCTTIQGQCWETWTDAVAALQPELLVVVGHLDDSDSLNELEIGGRSIAYIDLTPDMIRINDETSPWLILLGCSTKYSAEGIVGFADKFALHGASMVIGTVALIGHQQAVVCLEELTDALARARKVSRALRREGRAKAGYAMLLAKQRMFALRNTVALALAAAGDSEFEL